MKRLLSGLLALLLALAVLPGDAHAAGPEVEAKSALLMDVATGTVLYEQNAHEQLAPASVTKVMTMLLIMEAIDSGRIGWNDTVTVSETAAAKGGSQVYLKVGETMPVSDMVKSIAVSSANDCACAMAEFISGSEESFVEAMNTRARDLGMEDTHFVNCTGLDDSAEAANHLTSAYDIALMSRQLMKFHPDIKKYTTIWMDTIRNGQFGLSNTNKLIRFYPGATGLKTGFTSGAGYCLSATAQREGMELIAVVMGCETSPKRTAACKQLLDYGFANFACITAELEDEIFIPVTLGKEDQIQLIPQGEQTLLVDKSKRGQITTQVSLETETAAPVTQGQQLGSLTVLCGEEVLLQLPLVAHHDVQRLSWWDLTVAMLRRVAFGG